jgi:hypothetical protein
MRLVRGSNVDKTISDSELLQVDDVSGFSSKEAEAANATPGTIKHIKESNPFIARAFKRISAEGY